MADVVLKDMFGIGKVYQNIDSLSLNTENGEIATFVSEDLIPKQVQVNWDETDESSLAYIKNKPFGCTSLVIMDRVLEDEKDSEGNWKGEFMWLDSSDATLVVGDTYTVIWNSEEYICECIELGGLQVIGNTVVVGGENNNFPFTIIRDTIGALAGSPIWAVLLTILDDNGVYSCTISKNIIQKIDSKYIPEIESLPKVTEDDNGKIMQVQNGEWVVINAPFPVPVTQAQYEAIADHGDTIYLIVSDDA